MCNLATEAHTVQCGTRVCEGQLRNGSLCCNLILVTGHLWQVSVMSNMTCDMITHGTGWVRHKGTAMPPLSQVLQVPST